LLEAAGPKSFATLNAARGPDQVRDGRAARGDLR